MKILIIVVIAFLVAVYVFTFVKWRKRKNKNTSSIADFHKKYIQKETLKIKKKVASSQPKAIISHKTKIDYIVKDEYLGNNSKS